MKETIVEKGAYMYADWGGYDGHNVIGIYESLVNFELKHELESYLFVHPEQEEMYQFNEEEFMEYLINRGLIQNKNCDNLYLGNGGKILEEMRYDKYVEE